ncbi:MAG: FAD-dependent oxidoreductase, partial [Phycisphaeraceae bacterium]
MAARSFYDVIVIGGGHAGVEAAWAAANMLREQGPRGRGAAGPSERRESSNAAVSEHSAPRPLDP